MKTIATLFAAAVLTSCTTTTTTLPDGTTTTIRGSDPAAVAALSEILTEVAKAQIIAEK
jgi:hypothetical protein